VKNYTVVWWQEADEELISLWLGASDRAAITEASSEIDHRLSTLGANASNEAHEGLYALTIEPLRVHFSVEQEDRIVRIWTVRLIRS
jgi:hypothetical protein